MVYPIGFCALSRCGARLIWRPKTGIPRSPSHFAFALHDEQEHISIFSTSSLMQSSKSFAYTGTIATIFSVARNLMRPLVSVCCTAARCATRQRRLAAAAGGRPVTPSDHAYIALPAMWLGEIPRVFKRLEALKGLVESLRSSEHQQPA